MIELYKYWLQNTIYDVTAIINTKSRVLILKGLYITTMTRVMSHEGTRRRRGTFTEEFDTYPFFGQRFTL